MHYFSTLFW